MAQSVGARQNISLNERVEFEPNDGFNLTENISAKVQLLKLPHEINVQIRDLETAARSTCSKCLSPFELAIKVPFAEREFIIDLPVRDLEVGEDVLYVNKSTNEIDLYDMLREEILLHFPGVPVCFSSCKGLCDKCGKNLNKETCSCEHIIEAKVTPFSHPKF